MLAGQTGQGERVQAERAKGGGARGITPIMHFTTGHSNSMQRASECEAGPRPRADEAKPGACGHSNLDAVLLGSCP